MIQSVMKRKYVIDKYTWLTLGYHKSNTKKEELKSETQRDICLEK